MGKLIKKFQSAAGPIELNQKLSLARDTKKNKEGLTSYELVHHPLYGITNAVLYAAAPYTFGLTAIPATAMSGAALYSDIQDYKENGFTPLGAANTMLDVANILPGAAFVPDVLKAAKAVGQTGRALANAQVRATAAEAAKDAAMNTAKKAAVATAKLNAKKDALARVAYSGNDVATQAYKQASKNASEAFKRAHAVSKGPWIAVEDGVINAPEKFIQGTLQKNAAAAQSKYWRSLADIDNAAYDLNSARADLDYAKSLFPKTYILTGALESPFLLNKPSAH